jgi:hypothetical protein
MDVIVHNQYLDIELVSPVCFCNCGKSYEYPIEKTDTDAIIKIGSIFRLDQDNPGGILMYGLRRKRNTRSNHQFSVHTIYAKFIEEASKIMRLLAIWKINCFGKPKVNIILVEYDNELVLNEDKLAKLYNKIDEVLFNDSERTWLMYDNTALEARVEVHKEGFGLSIIISEETENKNNMKPLWIDSERQVLLVMVIYFLLIYIVSLTFQSLIDVTIDNQCSDIELTSPVCFIKDGACHVQFPQRVNPESVMKANFITGMNRDVFGGALLYHLKRKMDASISTQLLVIWGYGSYLPYSRALLIEHENTFTWDEDKLKRFYDACSRHRYAYFFTNDWLLNDNTRLGTWYPPSRGFKMNVSISKRQCLFLPRKPLWVDPNR